MNNHDNTPTPNPWKTRLDTIQLAFAQAQQAVSMMLPETIAKQQAAIRLKEAEMWAVNAIIAASAQAAAKPEPPGTSQPTNLHTAPTNIRRARAHARKDGKK